MGRRAIAQGGVWLMNRSFGQQRGVRSQGSSPEQQPALLTGGSGIAGCRLSHALKGSEIVL